MANQQIYNNTLIITGSVTASDGFYGDGSGLTGITAVAEWDGTRNGDAEITGSFLVSGSSVNVDFTNTTGVSGSFSGSFVGDGSGLTGVISDPSDTYKIYQIGAGTNSIVPVNGGNTSSGDCSTVGGGYSNIADDYLATIGGGNGNTACQASTVGGGFNNSASGTYSTIGGGRSNSVSGTYSSILGGKSNCILVAHPHSHIIGSNITSSKACTTFVNNLDVEGTVSASIFSGSFTGDGSGLTGIEAGSITFEDITNKPTLISSSLQFNDLTSPFTGSFTGSFVGDGSGLTGISGGEGDYSPFITGSVSSGILPREGSNCTTIGENATIAGGVLNTVSGIYSFIGGGACNVISHPNSSVVGGLANLVSNAYSSVVGGNLNSGSGIFSFIGGGAQNIVDGDYSSVVGGYKNIVDEDYSSIVGGRFNTASAACSGILGGESNYVNHAKSFIVGSNLTSDKACYTFMNNLDVEGAVSASIFSGSFTGDGSGLTGIISDPSDTYKVYQIGAESNSIVPVNGGNSASGYYSTIGGGRANLASGICSTVSGGYVNKASGSFSTVGGGVDNLASGSCSTVSGGYCNSALGSSSTLSGGYCNIASGSCSTLSGGYCNTASGYYSTIGGGYCNTASGNYSSILGGKSNRVLGTHSHSHIIGSNIESTATCYTFVNNLCNIGGGTSDCRLKENIQDIPYGLTQVKQLEPVSYNFINDESKKTKYGFLAQCVQEIFPELIYYHPTDKVDGEPVLQFDKEAIWVSLVNAIKEQQEQIVRLEERILLLENK
jgi:hypothetical protein